MMTAAALEQAPCPARVLPQNLAPAQSMWTEEKAPNHASMLGGAVLRGTNRGTQWSVAAEVTHLQRRVADLAAELQVQPLCVCSHIICALACTSNHHALLLEGLLLCSAWTLGPHLGIPCLQERA